ncbi:outer membrane beta-barrel protein [Neptunitalea lumnitzerae]|uniref:Collagen-binding protein n=1 Tax=Neptunitalea lumnitzerae TaxID=2965509 RepID=A0ABQ5MEA0_9FLAO|nr:outer membrane beta-barrel protein [Neptunitalea sp. Y10]GLB47677.1 collagen-binding protein [Neptunitalea sp. Y10]
MKKVTYFLLFFLCAFHALNAQDYKITGNVKDENEQDLASATVFAQTLADSTLINYTVTGTTGNFNLEFKTKQLAVRLVVTYNGYETYRKEIQLNKPVINAGTIALAPMAFELDGVSVTAEATPITVKADTLEFNASSFKVAPDSNVETLLKQLPGVDVTSDGTITVNGKEVNNILVNGKPFFGSDGKIATQNLPADLIKKIQVTDTKTKEEQLSGDDASAEEKTINLTIEEDKNKGLFGKATAGYGTDDRYESSLLFNTFKGDRKISVLGSSNNINSIGFSMDDIFDNMGGGRSQSLWVNSDGSFSINGNSFGGNTGITQSNMIGLNYADVYGKELVEPSVTYYFTETNTDNVNRTNTENLLPDRTTITASEYTTDNYSRGHNVSTDIEIKVDSTFSIYLNPKYNNGVNENNYSQIQNTTNTDGDILNESFNNSFEQRNTSSFSNELFLYKSFQKKGRGLSFRFENDNSKTESDLVTNSETYFYETGDPADIRNQNRFDNGDNDEYTVGVSYREPIADSLRLGFGMDYTYANNVDSRNTYDFNDTSGSYSDLNAEQSNYYESTRNTFSPELSLSLRKSKLRGSLDVGTEIVDFNNTSLYIGQTTRLDKNYVFPKVSARLNVRMGKSKSIWTNYRYNVSLPSAQQILPVANLANPLNTIIGNEDLKPSRRHNLYFNFNNYDWSTRSGFFMYAGGSYFQDQIVGSTVYDDANRATTTYQNLSDVYNWYAGFSINKQKKEDNKSLRYRLGMRLNQNKSKGLTNAELYESSGWQLTPSASLTYEITDFFSVEPSYEFNYYNTSYQNYVIDERSNYTHRGRVETTLYWPANLVWGNDFGYTYNSNIADGFRKDFYLWNTSLGYYFLDKKLLAKVKVYDILDQNLSTTRNITPTAIVDEENTVLKRYVMFSLTYNLEMFGGKRKSNNHFRMH